MCCAPLLTFVDGEKFLAQHAVLLEPGLHLGPGILGRVLAIAGAVVGVETVWSWDRS
jgi:hypothetical protein